MCLLADRRDSIRDDQIITGEYDADLCNNTAAIHATFVRIMHIIYLIRWTISCEQGHSTLNREALTK